MKLNIIKLLASISNWKFIIPFFLLTMFLLVLFNKGQSEMSIIVGEKVTLIDLWESYNLKAINTYFEQLKPEGRAIHQQLSGVNDMIFPFAYGPLFILIYAFLLKNIFGKTSNWLLLSLFPILTMSMDYLENFNTLEMLNDFPNLTEVMVRRGSFYTEIKNLSILIIKILFVLFGIAFVVKKGPSFLSKHKT